jgi:hypothetical protein
LKLLGREKEGICARSLALAGQRAWARDIRVNGPTISRLNHLDAFWQAIILVLMVIALVD